ncbi:c-type cytochrome [Microvirga pudoricolor]|uniref:c-type cytochrome n=1 Tax=Microvirga pudoricolor TaxID=2778729 RepID=UPI00194E95EC|nr:cytochrome c [Microvirga pudoricolor]MBM6594498.1 cytochrome c [Microvirga pudoricolor]
MKRVVLVAGLLGLGVAAAWAQGNVIEQRQAIMKSFGGQVRTVSGMLRGQAPFDLAQVQTALNTFVDGSQKAPPLFPPGSDAGDSKALPAVWEKKAEFDGLFVQFANDSKAALASIKDEASFKAAMPKVLENCGTCHKTFRKS